MTQFIVTLNHNGLTFPLRGTIWAMSMDRAQVFASREAAQAGLEKARKFMKAAQFKAARIVMVVPAHPSNFTRHPEVEVRD